MIPGGSRPKTAMAGDVPHLWVQEGDVGLVLADAVETVRAERLDEVRDALAHVAARVGADGLHALGYLAYEAAPAFDSALITHPPGPMPLLYFSLCRRAERHPLPPCSGAYRVSSWTPSVTRAAYERAIDCIRARLAAGETYQVNYTLRLDAEFEGRAWDLHVDLVSAQEGGHGAFLETEDWAICSASPELYLAIANGRIVAQPMKGTSPRGLTTAEDAARRDMLGRSAKERAENVMITDMVRHDLGRIALPGSIEVTDLCRIERYPTVWQMVSTVKAESRASIADIVGATFPSASVTGAPKAHTMRIIRELESRPRGVYTGAIGYLAPGHRASFNVAIRTVVIDKRNGRAEYGVGGGIVWDSNAADEFAEVQAKSRILAERRPRFALLESVRYEPAEGYWLLEEHLARLASSANYFRFPFDPERVALAFEEAAKSVTTPHKVRLTVARDGMIEVDASPIVPIDEPRSVVLARVAVARDDVFLYHKTTNRVVYDRALADRGGADDVLLWNEVGEITEASSSNVVVRLDGALVTPPVASGLLAGTLRNALLARGEIREAVVRREDLTRAEAIYLINSVRGWRRANLLERT